RPGAVPALRRQAREEARCLGARDAGPARRSLRGAFHGGGQGGEDPRDRAAPHVAPEAAVRREIPVVSISTAGLQAYVNRPAAEKYHGRVIRPETVKKEISTLQTICNRGKRNGRVSVRYPSGALDYPKGREKPPFRTYDQIEAIVRRGKFSKHEL